LGLDYLGSSILFKNKKAPVLLSTTASKKGLSATNSTGLLMSIPRIVAKPVAAAPSEPSSLVLK